MFKRIALLVLTNFAIMAAVGVIINVLNALGVFGHGEFMQNYGPLLVLSGVVGFGGSFISLLASKWIAKWQTKAHVIEQPSNPTEVWLLATVRRQADAAGIKMPEVAIYEAPEMNAFATGATRNSALIAVSTGLLDQMQQDEIEAVLGHEISHVANGDMVTMTLIQGVVNTFVIFLARVIGSVIDRAISGDRGGGIAYFAIVIVLQIVLGLFASMIVAAFSRWREYRADAGGADLAGREKMIAALARLSGNHGENSLPKAIQAFGISGGGMRKLFSSHPPLEQRIAALRAAV